MTEIQFADINQDGHPDLLTVGDHGSPYINTNQHGISVFFGNGTGTGWTFFQNGNFGYGGIAVGDVNNDNNLDVAYGIHHNYAATDLGDQLIEAVIGDGTGMNWIPWDDSLATAGETYGMFGTDLGDMDNDGLLDIVSGSFGCCAGTHVYHNNGNGSWQHAFGYINGNTGHYVQFGDLNHDSNLDFVCCHQYGAPYFGDGTGNFVLKHLNLIPAGNLGFNDISLGDVDNDGDDDFAFIKSNVPYVYKWNEATQTWIDISTGLNTGGTFSCIKLADVNMDGFMDVVAAVTGMIKIWLGNGGTLWNNTVSIAFPNMTYCEDIVIADVDHNGFPEIAFWADYTVSWFNSVNKLKMLRESSVPVALNITQLFPKGYECFPNGAVRFIKWSSAIPGNHSSSVSIEFSSAGNSGPWTVIETGVPNNGVYQWTVPQSVSSSNCYLRLVALDSLTMITDTAVNANPFQVGICNPTLHVAEYNQQHDISVFPNPFSQSTTLYSLPGKSTLKIFDLKGILLREEKNISFPYELHRGSLSAGVYVTEIISPGGTSSRVKLLVQ